MPPQTDRHTSKLHSSTARGCVLRVLVPNGCRRKKITVSKGPASAETGRNVRPLKPRALARCGRKVSLFAMVKGGDAEARVFYSLGMPAPRFLQRP